MKVNFEDLVKDSIELSKMIPKDKYKFVYGIPSGGILTAHIIAQEIGASQLTAEEFSNHVWPTSANIDNVLLVDDLIDSGNTIKKCQAKCKQELDTAVLYSKPHSPTVTYLLKQIPHEWVYLPHEKESTGAEEHIVRLLEHIGENPLREGLIDTPRRVLKMYKEIFRGYNKDLKPEVTVFKNGSDGIVYDEMIIDTGSFYSQCEHHMVPFFGNYWFAYVPNQKGNILGLSKVARIVDYYAAKLQIQERLTKDIVDSLWQALTVTNNLEQGMIEIVEPMGMALVIKAEHLCKTMRGCKKKGQMTTSVMKGVFKDKIEARSEFLSFINS